MKHILSGLFSLYVVVLCACGDSAPPSDPCQVTSLRPGIGLVVVSDFQTSALVAFAPSCQDAAREVAVLSGDAVVRKLDEHRAIALNRSLTASNLVIIGEDLKVGGQVDLPGCGPHDAALLPDGRVLVTCYEDAAARVVDLITAETERLDLSALADADGIPEMDAVIVVGDRAFVSLERFTRPEFVAAGNGVVAVIDIPSLSLVDTDATMEGVQGYELACQNPFSNFARSGDTLFLACANYFPANASSVVEVTIDGESSVVVSGDQLLGGVPSDALIVDSSGGFALAVAFFDEDFNATHMQVLRVIDGQVDAAYQVDGFNLGGIAFADDTLLVSDRSANARVGIYRVDVEGPVRALATALPPANIVVY